MLAPNSRPQFHALPDEVILHTTNNAISLSIESGKDLSEGDERKKTFSSPAGTVYLTNQRVGSIAATWSQSMELTGGADCIFA